MKGKLETKDYDSALKVDACFFLMLFSFVSMPCCSPLFRQPAKPASTCHVRQSNKVPSQMPACSAVDFLRQVHLMPVIFPVQRTFKFINKLKCGAFDDHEAYIQISLSVCDWQVDTSGKGPKETSSLSN